MSPHGEALRHTTRANVSSICPCHLFRYIGAPGRGHTKCFVCFEINFRQQPQLGSGRGDATIRKKESVSDNPYREELTWRVARFHCPRWEGATALLQTPSKRAGTHWSAGQRLQLWSRNTRSLVFACLFASLSSKRNRAPFLNGHPAISPSEVARRRSAGGANRHCSATCAGVSCCRWDIST
jgi:hypothetical protein